MHIIAESNSTCTEWVIAEGDCIIQHAYTSGLNPYFLTRREISHIIRLELPEDFFRRRWERVFFYGAGCATPEKNKIIESSLVAQFKTPSTVNSDLLGAARGMLQREAGLVSLLQTGANSCYYDGDKIAYNVRPGGYLLGDEGSASYMGRLMVSDMIKGIAPKELTKRFFDRFNTNADEIVDLIYSCQRPNIVLADYSSFLADNIDDPYCRGHVYNAFMCFFRRNISFYKYHEYSLAIVGKTAMTFSPILQETARDFGVTISKIESSPMEGLIRYHSVDQ